MSLVFVTKVIDMRVTSGKYCMEFLVQEDNTLRVLAAFIIFTIVVHKAPMR